MTALGVAAASIGAAAETAWAVASIGAVAETAWAAALFFGAVAMMKPQVLGDRFLDRRLIRGETELARQVEPGVTLFWRMKPSSLAWFCKAASWLLMYSLCSARAS